MAREREVGTLWIGGALSWMEQLCLKSFVDRGQKITLFSYEDIPNVPAGVIRRSGREIVDTDDFIKYEKKDSFALFADWFRVLMLAKCPGMIWVDTDVYCHRPLDYDDGHVFGYELPGRVNNAVLGLPAESAILADMLAFMEDRTPIPPFLGKALRRRFAEEREAGRPVHVSQMPWGVWGPLALTHFVHAHGLEGRAQPIDAFYPVVFPKRLQFLRPAHVVEAQLTANTTALHLWASNKRELGLRHEGLAPEGSYLHKIAEAHGIDMAAAPITGRGARKFDAALLEAVGPGPIERVADVGGTAPVLLSQLHARHDCDLWLVDMDRRGRFPQDESPGIAAARERLAALGVPPDRVRVLRRPEELRPADAIFSLNAYGDTLKIKHFAPVLERMLHSETRLFLDLRKGQGGYPFLRGHGELETLSRREDQGVEVARIRFTPRAPEPAAALATGGWPAIARGLAGREGFYREGTRHSFLHIRRGPVLVVTFDNLDIAMNNREDRRPWGYRLIEEQGFSMLAAMAGGWTWYRDPWVSDEFDRLAAEGFFDRFERVVFYGASMGGYAACAFSGAAPGADVVAISPQSTVDKSVVPWETRYKVVWDADFSGKYGDAALVSGAARRINLIYDPYEKLDAGHAARFEAPNVHHMRAPLLGHRLGSSLLQMGVLKPIVLGALSGSLTEAEFYRLLRARKTFPRYQRELFERAVARGRPGLAHRVGRFAEAHGGNRQIARALERLA
ncbi:MAG: hypothetical protein JJU40_13815 [Rhodobacteraceae bacterium]|nr:hypothetical protein [Paracoccaceae bacterium]